MADVATAPVADLTNDNKTGTGDKAHKARPEKPDEEKYKTDLAKAEKEHAVAQEKLVCLSTRLFFCQLKSANFSTKYIIHERC